jgi:N-acetylmuramoyl-L-alanine amidase
MEQRTRRRPTKRYNSTILLLGIVLVLAVIFVVVLCIALGTGNGSDPTNPATTVPPVTVPSTTTQPIPTTQPKALEMPDPDGTAFVTLENTYTFYGSSDPNHSLTVNGQEVTRQADGTFSVELPLNAGINTFTFQHWDKVLTYTVDYRVVVQSFYPNKAESFNSGATIVFELFIREGSTASVKFNGNDITMKQDNNQYGTGVADGFVRYTGEYKLTSTNSKDLDLGCATFTVTCNGVTETYQSGNITCLKAPELDGWDEEATPEGGKYINVGSGYICEVITYSAETFSGKTTDDYSRPTNNYLPEGTVDYCSTELVNGRYALLRSGHRVYVSKKNTPMSKKEKVIDRYKGTLPNYNEIGIASWTEEGNRLVLTLDTLWKAPFYFDIAPQDYRYPQGGSDRNYSVTSFTAEYVDITFCYATTLTGTLELPENPLFSHAEVIKNTSDHTLRLHLKKQGGFYGWDACYNEDGQLCFLFLKPGKATAANNAYGADLTGITVMVDVGHGGYDGGAVGEHEGGIYAEEADCNLALAKALQKELESIGATVILNRYEDETLTLDERISMLKQAKPDLCIAVHHNAYSGHPNITGLEVYYFTPYTQRIADLIHQANKEDTVYKKVSLNWHVYFMARESTCPVVLMESGYVSSPYDAANMLDPVAIETKAKAMARGVARYYLELNEQ